MTTIKANCPTCGEVSLSPDDVALHADPDVDLDVEPFYAFDCPACSLTVRKAADEHVVRLLRSAGVAWATRALPAGPPLTLDDVIDFHALLASDDWFDKLLALV